MRRYRLFALAALFFLALPLGIGAMGLACGDDCFDNSCGDCVQCQPCGVGVATAPLEAPRFGLRLIPPTPEPRRTVAPARTIEHVPLPA